MPIVLGNTTISGLGVGGLPAGTVNADSLASSAVTRAKMGYAGAVLQVVSANQTSFLNTTSQGGIEILSLSITPVFSNSNFIILAKTGGQSGDDSEIWLEYNLNGAGFVRNNLLNGVGDRKCIGDMMYTHGSNGGCLNVSTAINVNFGTTTSLAIRLMGAAENNTGGGLFINTGTGGGFGGFNFDSCQTNMIIMEIKV